MASWLVTLAPAGTPQPIVDRLNAETDAAIKEPVLRDKILNLGAIPMGGSPQEVAKFLQAETQKWKVVIEAAAIKIE